jgi:hypothetical protein
MFLSWPNQQIIFYTSGDERALNSEMDDEINLKKAHKRYRGNGFFGGTGRRDVDDIEVNSEYPLVSFITMIAPSPDWFVGVHDYNLCNTTTGKWLDSRTRDLPPYDAGTDSGLNFDSPNQITNPKENIHLLTNNTEGSFKGDKPVNRFGTFTFVKTYDSNPIIKPSSTIQQRQPSASVNAERSTMMMDRKESSTQQVELKITPSTATITVSASVKMTPTLTTTSAAGSVKQFGFIPVIFATILVHFCL